MMVLGGFASGVRSAAFSRDGRLIITGSDDSARLWDARTGAELLRRFSFDSSDWAAVAPDGRYDGSQPGFGRLHYALGLQTIPVTTFLEKFYVPELTEAILSGAPYTGPDLRHGFGLPPAVRIVSPRSGDTVSATVTVTVEVRDQGGGVEEPRPELALRSQFRPSRCRGVCGFPAHWRQGPLRQGRPGHALRPGSDRSGDQDGLRGNH